MLLSRGTLWIPMVKCDLLMVTEMYLSTAILYLILWPAIWIWFPMSTQLNCKKELYRIHWSQKQGYLLRNELSLPTMDLFLLASFMLFYPWLLKFHQCESGQYVLCTRQGYWRVHKECQLYHGVWLIGLIVDFLLFCTSLIWNSQCVVVLETVFSCDLVKVIYVFVCCNL